MRPVPLWTVLALAGATLLAGCGGSKPSGSTAENVIEGDWDGAYVVSSPFPSRPDLAGYSTIDSIHCQRKPVRHRVHCRLVVANNAGSRKRLAVIATFNADGVVSAWRFA